MNAHSGESVPIRYLQSQLLTRLGVKHGFATRVDGVSPPPFDSLNMSELVGDDPNFVAENRRRLLWDLDLGARELLVPSQVHGVECALGKMSSRDGVLSGGTVDQSLPLLMPGGHCEADAILSCDPSLALAIGSADCIPMLLSTADGYWVAAVHGGWRGTAGGILRRMVKTLSQASGQAAEELFLAIGPGIGLDSYEVGEEVVAACLNSVSFGRDEAIDKGVLRIRAGRHHVCLKSINQAQALEFGLKAEHIDVLWRDTYAEKDTFFSFRRDGGVTGRHLNIIAPRGAEEGGAGG